MLQFCAMDVALAYVICHLLLPKKPVHKIPCQYECKQNTQFFTSEKCMHLIVIFLFIQI